MLELNKIYNMDCLEGMKQIKDNSIPLIITDPPYNINYKSNRSLDKKYRERIQKTEWDINFDIKPFFNEMMRILKEDGVLYLFGRSDTYDQYPIKANNVLVWDKLDFGLGDLNWYSTSYEFIYVFRKNKGKANWCAKNRPEGIFRHYKVQNFNSEEGNPNLLINNQFMKHPTQKPIKLIRDIIKNHNINLILDPFMGSGTTAVASKQLNRNFIGFEISKDYCDIANKRLQQENLFTILETNNRFIIKR